MNCTLILMRHAKSSWDSPTLSDHARPLNKRGRDSASALGTWLKDNDHIPDMLLSSTSARTRETYDRLALTGPSVTYMSDLYHASADAMLRVLKNARRPRVLMLGHNPGIAAFADALAEKAPDHPRFLDYPTGATTVFSFPINSWDELQTGTGTVVDFVIPRELTQA